jgi:outer membrane protein assembly factor BamD (BamD/ComL family)
MFSLIALITYLHLLIYTESNGNSQDDAATSDTTREIAAVVAEYPYNPDATAGVAGAAIAAIAAAAAAAAKELAIAATMEIESSGIIFMIYF